MTSATASPDTDGEYGDATPDDLIQTIKKCAKEWRQARGPWLEEARECYDFVAGHQWTDDELTALRDARRPPVVFDRVEPIINVVTGLEVTNRQEVRYLPREVNDSGVTEVWSDAGKYFRDQCNAEDEESEAFRDMAICGEGWTETRLDYEYDQDGTVLTERVDPFEILPDSSSQKKNYRDGEGLIREKMVSPVWAKETWPDRKEELEAQEYAADDNSQFDGERHLDVQGDQYKSPGAKTGNRYAAKFVKLTEYQYKKRVPYYRVQDLSTGQVLEMEVDQYNSLKERAEQIGMPIKGVRQVKCVHYRAFAIGEVLLENATCPDPSSFTYHAMTDKRDRKKRCWYGLVRKMRDPQRWSNKFFSQSMHILNVNAKGGVMIEETAVKDMAKFEESWAHPDKPTVFKDGALTANRVQPKQPPAFPPELPKLLEFSIASLYQVSGVSPEMLGAVDRDQPAVLEYQRKQAGVTILATLFDALRKYRKEQGRNLLYLIQTYLSDGRLVRIVGEAGAKYVPLTKQEGASRYDVVIDESPSSPNQKEKTWMVIERLLPLAAKGAIQLPPEIMEYLPLPQSLIDAMKKPDPAKDQAKQQQKELQMRGAVAEVSKTEAEANLANAKAQAEGQGNNAEMAKVAAGHQADMAALQQKGQLTREEMAMNAALARQEMAFEHALKQQEAAFDAKLEQWKATMQANLQERTAAHDASIKARTADAQVQIAAKKARAKPKAKAA